MSDPAAAPAPPPAVSDALGNAGTLLPIRWRGREYPVALPCPAVIDRIEKQVVRSALDSLAEVRAALTPAEYAADQEALRAAIRAKEYRPGGSLWLAELKADGGVRGARLIVWGCLAEGHTDPKTDPPTLDDVADLAAEEPDEFDTAVAWVMPDFWKAAGKKQRLPAATIAAQVAKAEERRATMLADRTGA